MTTDVTGRDRHIITKALAYAIEAIDALPDRWQEKGDKADMKKLLEAMVPSDVELGLIRRSAINHLRQGKID